MVWWLGVALLPIGVVSVVWPRKLGNFRIRLQGNYETRPEGVESTDVEPTAADVLLTRLAGVAVSIVVLGLVFSP